jgi:PAS domain S-box-containing protein
MLYVGIGQAEGIDTRTIVERVIEDCIKQLEGKSPKAGIVFAGPYFEHDVILAIINDRFPGISLIGCSTSGNFSSLHGVSDDAVTLVLLASDQICFAAGVGKDLSKDYQSAVSQAISTATSSLPDRPALCLTFPHAYGIPFEPILKRLDTDLGPDCPVFGGVAGTLLTEWTDIVQFYGRETLKDSLPILLMSGPVKYRFSIANSWRPVGKRAIVNRSHDRRVYKIGSLNAVDYYRNYLGYHEEPAGELMIAVYDSSNTEYYYICAPLHYHEDGSITFTGNIPEGSEVQLTEAMRGDLIRDTRTTSKALSTITSDWIPSLSINFSCGYRKTILGTEVEKELESLRDSSPPGLPITGFFSFGEISPLSSGGPSILHGATLITLLIGPGLKELPKSRLPDPIFSKLSDSHDPKQNELLKRKLMRSEASRRQLESLKEFSTQMHRQVIKELEEARLKIQRKEEQLRESEEKYRRIVQTAGQGFVLMDESLTIVDANAAYCQLIRAQLSDVLNRKLLDSVVPEEQPLFLSNINTQQGESHQRFEGTLVTLDGEIV